MTKKRRRKAEKSKKGKPLFLPGYENLKAIIEWIFLIPMVVGELGLGLWLLIRGVNVSVRVT